MKCPKCQAGNRAEAYFCRACGNRLEAACPVCGNLNTPRGGYCDECGHALRKREERPATDSCHPRSHTPDSQAEKPLATRKPIEDERKLVTVLFADVVNYTSISHKLDPEQVHEIMNGCVRILTDEIRRYGGIVNQFTGDGVMALFGAPVAHEDHARRACQAALTIRRALGGYGEKVEGDYGVEFRIRMGLDSGHVVMGSIGNDPRMEYTAVGDATNQAFRMQGMAEPGTVVVSGHTERLARDFFEFESLGKVPVKGREEPQEVFELRRARAVETRIEAAVAKGLTRFVGRERELEFLRAAYEKAREGSGRVVGVAGEAGVGKSRLVLEMKKSLPAGEYTLLEGGCLHYGDHTPYLPILDVLKAYFNLNEGDPEPTVKKKLRGKIGEPDETIVGALPALHEILSLEVEDEEHLRLGPQQRRERAFEAIRHLLTRESRRKPLVLALEDLHWIDKTSQEFLDDLIEWLQSARILLILLYRPEYAHPWAGKSCYSEIPVGQLPMQGSEELVEAILEGGEPAPELRGLILERAAGNPLFTEELVHSLLESGSIRREGNRYVLSGQVSEIEVPETIEGVIASRMDRLEDSLKWIVQVASVMGDKFAFGILETITGPGEDLKGSLLDLQGLEFIYEKRPFPELEYVFKHALTREVAYKSLLRKRRKDLHGRIGHAIERTHADRLEDYYETLAYHYSSSGNTERARRYLTLSGDKAANIYAGWEALRFYREAIQALDARPETEETKREKLKLYFSMLNPLMFLNYPEGTLEILESAERLSRELGDEWSLASVYGRMGLYHALKGNLLLGIEYAEKCSSGGESVENIQAMAQVAGETCFTHFATGDFLKVAEVAGRVLDLLGEHGGDKSSFFSRFNVYSQLSGLRGSALGFLGRFGEAGAVLQKGLDKALELDDKYGIAFTEFFHAAVFFWQGDGENTAAHVEKAIEAGEEMGIDLWVGVARSLLGAGNLFLGRHEPARSHAETGLEIQKERGIPVLLPLCYGVSAVVHSALGDLRTAGERAEEALKLAREFGTRAYEGWARMVLGSILWKSDPAEDGVAEEQILRGISMLEELEARAWSAQGYLFLGELFARTRRTEKALENLKHAEGLYRKMGLDSRHYWPALTRELIAKTEPAAGVKQGSRLTPVT